MNHQNNNVLLGDFLSCFLISNNKRVKTNFGNNSTSLTWGRTLRTIQYRWSTSRNKVAHQKVKWNVRRHSINSSSLQYYLILHTTPSWEKHSNYSCMALLYSTSRYSKVIKNMSYKYSVSGGRGCRATMSPTKWSPSLNVRLWVFKMTRRYP